MVNDSTSGAEKVKVYVGNVFSYLNKTAKLHLDQNIFKEAQAVSCLMQTIPHSCGQMVHVLHV